MYGYQYDRAGARCAAGPAAGAVALRDGVLEVEPRLGDLGIFNCRPPRGVTPGPGVRVSLHGEGRAWDAAVADRELGDWLAAELVRLSPVLGVQEVIWWRRMWRSSTRAWAAYGGPGLDPHTGHVHVGLCRAAAATLRRATVVEAFRPADDDEEDEMDRIVWFEHDGRAHAYRLRGITGKHLDGDGLALCRKLRLPEPPMGDWGGVSRPLGAVWQGTVILVDGPCRNQR